MTRHPRSLHYCDPVSAAVQSISDATANQNGSIPDSASRRWWREIEVVLLVLLVIATYFTRLTTLTPRGEETRRALVAAEMIRTGDWVVPRQQGTLFSSRPPLQNWLIAALALLRDKLDAVTMRLPTVLAVLATTVLIYAYSRTFLTRFGAFAAAAAYPTMGQVLEIGRFAETEGLFTLLVSASLLLWHWGYTCRWPPHITWILGYGLAGLAGLTKGVQGPVYFVASSWCLLAWRRDWHYLFGRPHLAGVAALLIVIGSWQVPFYLRTDWPSTFAIWLDDIVMHADDYRPSIVLKHLLGYPFEVFVCMLPWSIAFVAFSSREVRATVGHQARVSFLALCLALSFPPLWLATGARPRYFMPLYPIAAVLIGTALESCWNGRSRVLRTAWSHFVIGIACTAVAMAAVLLIAGEVHHPTAVMIAQPRLFAVGFLASAIGVAIVLGFARQSRKLGTGRLAILGIAAFMGMLYTGAVVNALARVQADPAADIAALKRELPVPSRLVSLGAVHHRFRYFYEQPIALLPWPEREESLKENFDYFCFDGPAFRLGTLPFLWEQLAVVSMHRNRTSAPDEVVIVGRRLRG